MEDATTKTIKWEKLEPWQYRFSARNDHPAAIPFRGLTIYAPGGLYHPWPLSSSHFIADRLPEIRGKTVLDLGCGTGVLGLWLADPKYGNCVTLTDIDPVSVAVAECNAMMNERFARILRTDLFGAFGPGRAWECVIFNAPLLCTAPPEDCPPQGTGAPQGTAHRMGTDPEGRTTKRFLAELPSRLERNGVGYLPWSPQVGADVLRLCQEHGLTAECVGRDWRESGIEVQLLEVRCG